MKGEKEGIDILNGKRLISDLPFVYRAHNYFSLDTKHTQIVFCVIPTVDPIPDGISFRISVWKGEYFQVICKNVMDSKLIHIKAAGIINESQPNSKISIYVARYDKISASSHLSLVLSVPITCPIFP